MGDRTKLCDYTNTPNDQFIAKPITTHVVGLNSINIAENVPLTLEETLNELLNYPEYMLPFMSHLMASKEEVSKTEHDERKLKKLRCLVKLMSLCLISRIVACMN